MKEPLVSIIIPTYNADTHLETCLASIKKQSYKKIEVIVVDQESTDKTKAIAKKYKVTFLTRPKPKFYSPPSVSRNMGAGKAKGSILYHLDSDMSLPKNLIKDCVTIFDKNRNIGAIIVHEKDIVKGFWSKCKALERRCYWGNDAIESARVVKTSVFKKNKRV